eukprot:GHVH01011079.1.p1 GENE.GHVH01011079.1~~GHVH01011079.1.p1  ORF type:complete len:601 (+),score=49.72 GHVH01011079.1:235-1803(+)
MLDAALQLQIWQAGALGDSSLWKHSAKDEPSQCLQLLVQENLPLEIIAQYVSIIFDHTSFGGLLLLEQAHQIPYAYRCMTSSGGSGPSMLHAPLPREFTHQGSAAEMANEWIHNHVSYSTSHKYDLEHCGHHVFNEPSVYTSYSPLARDPNAFNSKVSIGAEDPITRRPYQRNPWALPEHSNKGCLVVDLGQQSVRVTPMFIHEDYPKKTIHSACKRTALGGIIVAAVVARGLNLRSNIGPGNNSMLERSILEETALCSPTQEDFVRTMEECKQKIGLQRGVSFVSPDDPNYEQRLSRDANLIRVALPWYNKKVGRDPRGPKLYCLRDEKVHPQNFAEVTEKQKTNSDVEPLPGADTIFVSSIDRYSAGEMLFTPALVPHEFIRETFPSTSSSDAIYEFGLPSIVHAVSSSILSAPKEIQPLLSAQIFLSGGLASIPGLKERLMSELRPRIPDAYPIGLYAPQNDPGLLPWMGASFRVAAYPEAVDAMAVTRKMFNDLGPMKIAQLIVQNLEAIATIDQILV